MKAGTIDTPLLREMAHSALDTISNGTPADMHSAAIITEYIRLLENTLTAYGYKE